MDKVHISAFPDHLIPHEDMPGQHTKRCCTQDLKHSMQYILHKLPNNFSPPAAGSYFLCTVKEALKRKKEKATSLLRKAGAT
jgi:hypothetical protein